jgi:hypothetical protein
MFQNPSRLFHRFADVAYRIDKEPSFGEQLQISPFKSCLDDCCFDGFGAGWLERDCGMSGIGRLRCKAAKTGMTEAVVPRPISFV